MFGVASCAFVSVPSSPVNPDTCPDDDEWFDVPGDIKIDLHVVARGKSDDLRTTLTSLGSACYPDNSRLALHVWARTRDAQEVLTAQDGFVWNHGTYQFHTLPTDHGEVPPLEGWARMWKNPAENEVRLVLPEGLELSNLFYFWLSSTLERYMGDGVTIEELQIFRNNVFGISLSATGLSEVSGRPLSWEAYKAADGRHPIFHTLPGLRGTAFFGWHWGAFAAFMEARARVLDADSWEDESLLPGGGARHSWAGSLERFLAEFGHGRGLGILHPNLTGEISFARQKLQAEEKEKKEEKGEEEDEEAAEEEEGSTQTEGANTPTPALRGGSAGEWERPPEKLVRTYKDAMYARTSGFDASAAPGIPLHGTVNGPTNEKRKPVRYDAIWEFGFLEELLGRDKVILQADFTTLVEDEQAVQSPESVYLVDMPIKQLSGNGDYFSRMGWGELPQIPLPLPNSTEAGWSVLRDIPDQVLAVSAMFGMFQHRSLPAKGHGGHGSGERGRGGGGGRGAWGGGGRGRQGGAETQFMCAHIRRQDFEASCARYREEFESGSAREWVKDALGNGGLCWVEEANFRNTVDVLLRQAPHELAVVPRFVFATSDDAHFLEATKHGNMVPVFTLDDVSLPAYAAGRQHFGGYSNGSKETSASAAGQSITADEVSAALPAIDVAVCSRAALLMLNYFSTYSALIKAKAKAQPDFVRGLYWADPPALSNWWLQFRAWLRKKFRSS
eukprot:jgi/Undpi1/5456/HiC_scaffold_2.g00735.m1